jgi:hypothetical protein
VLDRVREADDSELTTISRLPLVCLCRPRLHLGGFTNPSVFAASLFQDTGTIKKGSPLALRGIRVLPLISSKGGTLNISMIGAPLPVELAKTAGGNSGKIDLNYPANLVVGAPPGACTIAQVEHDLGV